MKKPPFNKYTGKAPVYPKPGEKYLFTLNIRENSTIPKLIKLPGLVLNDFNPKFPTLLFIYEGKEYREEIYFRRLIQKL